MSLCCAEPTDPLNTSYAWDISHALITTYHLYSHSPSALTEYLKQKLRIQRAKCLGRSPSAQVKQDIPLECNTSCPGDAWHSRAATCQSPPLVQEVSDAYCLTPPTRPPQAPQKAWAHTPGLSNIKCHKVPRPCSTQSLLLLIIFFNCVVSDSFG